MMARQRVDTLMAGGQRFEETRMTGCIESTYAIVLRASVMRAKIIMRSS